MDSNGPRATLTDHQAAVKALAWCPFARYADTRLTHMTRGHLGGTQSTGGPSHTDKAA
jgi:hypothetical protein